MRRAASLERLTHFFDRVAERVRYTAAPLAELFYAVADNGEFSDLPLLVHWRCQSTDDPREALQRAIAACRDEMGLSVQDERLLAEFAEGFGAADLSGEVSRCRHFVGRLEEQCAAAREALHRKGRLYITLGLCGGGAAVLMLI